MQFAQPNRKTARLQVSVSKEELFYAIIWAKQNAAHLNDLFCDHQILSLFYEDLAENREEVFCQVQEFLGGAPGPP